MTTDTITAPAPIETVTPIKPSEAIRLGCLTTRQGFGYYVDEDAPEGTACALGAMALGFGAEVPGDPERYLSSATSRAFDDLDCPECSNDGDQTIVPHLNDDHRWSRERIADWLEGIGL